MNKIKKIYLLGISSIFLSAFLTVLWLVYPVSAIMWSGLFLFPLAFFIAIITLLYAISAHLKHVSIHAGERYRFRHLVGHAAVLGLAIALAFQGFNQFRHAAAEHVRLQGQSLIEIEIKNAAGVPLKNIQLRLGEHFETIAELQLAKHHLLHWSIDKEPVLLEAAMGELSEHNLRQTQLWVDPSIKRVILTIDIQQNILPSLQTH